MEHPCRYMLCITYRIELMQKPLKTQMTKNTAEGKNGLDYNEDGEKKVWEFDGPI